METEQIETDENTALILEVENTKAIQSADHYRHVATLRGLIKDMVDKITASKKPGIDSAKAHLDLLKKELSDDIDPLNEKYKGLGGLLSAWNDEQEALKKKRELEIDLENKRKAQAEKEELAKLASQLGDKALAREIKAAPLELPTVVVTKDVPKVEGLSYSEMWHYEVTDLMALVKAVAAGKVPIQAIADPSKEFRSGYLHSMATRLKNTLQYPGVRVWSTKDPRQK
jgi:hypothetical protein